MDLNNRDDQFEKSERLFSNLKESFSKMRTNRTKLLNENAFKVGELLKKGQAIKEEELPKDDDMEVTEVPPTEGQPQDDGNLPPVDGEVPPVSMDEPELSPDGSDGVDSQDQLTTREFVKEFLKTLPTDVDLEASVDGNGVFKANVNDQHEGQFVVVAFPVSKNIHEVADILEPKDVSSEPVAPTDTGDVPVDEPALDAPVDEPALDAPVDEPELDAPVEDEDEISKEKLQESKRELERDPIVEGKRNWAAYKTLLKESEHAALEDHPKKGENKESLTKEKETLEKRVASIEKQLKDETDAEEKESLKKDLGTAKLKHKRVCDRLKDLG